MLVSELAWTKRRRLLGAVVICVVLIAGLTIWWQMGQVAEAAILTPYDFYDNFSGDLSRWTVLSGTWAIESGELSQSTVDGSYVRGKIKINDLNAVNLTVEARVKFVELHPNSLCYAGLAVRYLDDDTFYWVVLNQPSDADGLPSSNLRIELRARFNYIATVDLGFVGGLNKFYKLKVEVKGNDFKVYVDDVLEIASTDTTFQNAGSILAWTGRCHAHFDDVGVRDIDSAEACNTYAVNIRAGATVVVVTCTWSGSGNITVKLISPTKIYYESNMTLYEKTKASVSGGTTSLFNIKRATLSIAMLTSSETWILHLGLTDVTTYEISVEII